MDLLHLVDRLEELVASAQKMPIGNRAIIDRRRLLDIVDQMRIAIPHEVREAEEMVLRRDEVKREAEEEARIIVARAEEEAARLVEQHEVVKAAHRRAEEIAAQADARIEERIDEANEDIARRIEESRALARQQMEAADEYAGELLVRLRRQLEAFVRSVDSGLRQLEPDRPGPAPVTESSTAAAETDAESAPDAGAPDRAEENPAPRDPVPLRGARPQPEEDDGELENLLRPRQQRPDPPPPASEDVIDDYANPSLDDDPTRGRGEP